MLPLALAESLLEEWTGSKVNLAGQSQSDAVSMSARAVSWAPSDAIGAGKQMTALQQVILTACSSHAWGLDILNPYLSIQRRP